MSRISKEIFEAALAAAETQNAQRSESDKIMWWLKIGGHFLVIAGLAIAASTTFLSQKQDKHP